MTPHPITLNHDDSSAEQSSDGDDEIIHGGQWDEDETSEEEEDEDQSDEDEFDEEDEEDDGSWDPVNDIIPKTRAASGHGSLIDPRESASQSNYPPAPTRSYTTGPGKQPAGRGKVPRGPPKVPDPPAGSPPGRRARPRRSHSARPRSVVDEPHEDYPYGRNRGGAAEMPYYPPQPSAGGWNRGGGGFDTGSMISSFDSPWQYQRDDFSPFSSTGNPFADPPDSYFRSQRNRQSMPYGGGSELTRYGSSGYPGSPYSAYPPSGYPGYPPYPYPPMQQGPPQVPTLHTPSPHASKKGTPAPPQPAPTPGDGAVVVKAPTPDPGIKMLQDYIAAQEKARADKIAQKQKDKDDAAAAAAAAAKKAEEDKLDALQKLILEHNKAQLEREKQRLEEWEAERKKKEDAEKAAAEAKRIQAEKDKEIKAAAEKATLEAEKKAAEEAAKKKEEYDKEMEEIKKKQSELEEAKKKAEAEAKQLRPGDDMKKAPIRFKDAVGRKFSFPWHLCKTWKGMDTLIQQAFLHIDVIGQHVHDGHFDLIGPDGEIILPQVWETMIKPDTFIEMKMWPMPERKGPPPDMMAPPPPMALPPPPGRPGKLDKKGKRSKHDIPPPPSMLPPPPGMGPLPPPPPIPGPPPGIIPMHPGDMGPPPQALPAKDKKKKKAPAAPLLWFAGGPRREQSLKAAKKHESASHGAPTSSKQHKAPANENGKPARPSAENGKAEKTKGWLF